MARLTESGRRYRRKCVVDEQPHDATARGICRSFVRYAANRRACAISCGSRSGYARSISDAVTPSAVRPTTVATGIRKPRRQGTPPIYLGSIVMRSSAPCSTVGSTPSRDSTEPLGVSTTTRSCRAQVTGTPHQEIGPPFPIWPADSPTNRCSAVSLPSADGAIAPSTPARLPERQGRARRRGAPGGARAGCGRAPVARRRGSRWAAGARAFPLTAR